jgi:hypothetical protein
LSLKIAVFTFAIACSWTVFSQTVVKIVPLFGGRSIELNHEYKLKDSTRFNFSTLCFYVSNVGISSNSGEMEVKKIHLFDLEEPSSFELFQTSESVRSIHFLLGTDSLTNVSGILDGPLDPIRGMYWTWNSGYINFKLEGNKTTGNSLTDIEYHLGGYLPPYATSRRIHLDNSSLSKELKIEIHLDEWLMMISDERKNSIMIPGKEATILMDQLVPNIRLGENE